MKITEIIVSAGRVVPHPTAQYSNFKPNLTLKATLDESEDLETAVKELQAKAEKLVEDHKNNLVESIQHLEEVAREEQEFRSLEEQMRRAQERLERLRANPSLALPVVRRRGTYSGSIDVEPQF